MVFNSSKPAFRVFAALKKHVIRASIKKKATYRARSFAALEKLHLRNGTSWFPTKDLMDQVKDDAARFTERLGPRAASRVQAELDKAATDRFLDINETTHEIRITDKSQDLFTFFRKRVEDEPSENIKEQMLRDYLAQSVGPDRAWTKVQFEDLLEYIAEHYEVFAKTSSPTPEPSFMMACETDGGEAEAPSYSIIDDSYTISGDQKADLVNVTPLYTGKSIFESFANAYPTPETGPRCRTITTVTLPGTRPSSPLSPCRNSFTIFGDDDDDDDNAMDICNHPPQEPIIPTIPKDSPSQVPLQNRFNMIVCLLQLMEKSNAVLHDVQDDQNAEIRALQDECSEAHRDLQAALNQNAEREQNIIQLEQELDETVSDRDELAIRVDQLEDLRVEHSLWANVVPELYEKIERYENAIRMQAQQMLSLLPPATVL